MGSVPPAPRNGPDPRPAPRTARGLRGLDVPDQRRRLSPRRPGPSTSVLLPAAAGGVGVGGRPPSADRALGFSSYCSRLSRACVSQLPGRAAGRTAHAGPRSRCSALNFCREPAARRGPRGARLRLPHPVRPPRPPPRRVPARRVPRAAAPPSALERARKAPAAPPTLRGSRQAPAT